MGDAGEHFGVGVEHYCVLLDSLRLGMYLDSEGSRR